MPPFDANISRHLALMAAARAAEPALKIPRGRTHAGNIDYLTLTFAELNAEATAWHARLVACGVRRGDRVLVMVRQGLPLIASAFALFRLGAVPVIIDPGMGRKNFLAAVARTRPRALVGIPLARLFSHLFRRAFASVEIRVAASGNLAARLTDRGPEDRGQMPEARSQRPNTEIQIPNSKFDHSASTPHSASIDDLAAILFTSGSTGAPKGVRYTHGNFDAQVRLVRDTYGLVSGEVDLPLLPIFALFNPALGLTTIVPEIDPRRPAALDPAKIVQAIRQENVTNSFGSPTLWAKISAHCRAANVTLPSLRRVLCAGAPVPAALWRDTAMWMPNGRLHSPYGATEALPIATISDVETMALQDKFEAAHSPSRANLEPQPSTPGGACLGHPIREIQVKLIAPTDAPLTTLADAIELPPNEPGEIIVSGPVVTESYDGNTDATKAAKIQGTHGAVWHRMGDIGYLDATGDLWFCGRKAERVYTSAGPLDTEPCEQVFRAHPRAARCALIGLGECPAQRPALVAETTVADSREGRALARELRALALTSTATAAIKIFYFRGKFPVDVRHNAKIHRLTLARWAATATGYESDPKR
ncbi:MAG: fatty acid CoA ligase family protein [Verrucomicrobiota bacterium]